VTRASLFSGALALLVSLVSIRAAEASGLNTARFGGEHGQALATNPTAIYYNPAGIAESEGTHLYADLVVAYKIGSYVHERAEGENPEPADARGANYGEANLLSAGGSPMLGASTKIGNLALGLAAYIPMGGGASWGKNEEFENHPRYAGPYDGVQRWFSIQGIFSLVYTTAAVAYRIEPARLSIGVSGSLIYGFIESVRAQNLDGSNELSTETRSLLKASGVFGGFGAGAVFEAVPKRVWLAASYQSRPNISGGIKLEGTLEFANADGKTDVQIEQDVADVIRFGVRVVPAPRYELRLFGDYSRWSAVSTQCLGKRGKECKVPARGAPVPPDTIQFIRRDWHDAFGVRLGVSHWLDDSVEVFSGIGYDSTAIPDETLDPALPDFHDVQVALGTRFRVAEPVFVAVGYTHLFSVPRDTRGKSESEPDSGGFYRQMIGIFNTNVEVIF